MKPREFWISRMPDGELGYAWETEAEARNSQVKLEPVHAVEYSQYQKAHDLLWDLDQILTTALHNGHHDLIARVKDFVDTKNNKNNGGLHGKQNS